MANKRFRRPPRSWQNPAQSWHDHWFPLFDKLVLSDTWTNLSPQACKLYILLNAQYRGDYSGESVKCPYNYCIKHGFNRGTLCKYFQELEDAGLITITSKGGLYKTPSEYTFSSKWWEKETVNNAP